MRFSVILIVSSLLISACSWLPFSDSVEETAKRTEEEALALSENKLRDKIHSNLDARNWADAITNLNTFEAQFPFGNYAEQAQLELIYVYHESSDHQGAIASAERFIRLHPRHPNVDYAFYLKGLSETFQNKGLFSDRSPIDSSKRDVGGARSAFTTFSDLITLYPDSPYSADARQRMLDLRNQLARHEIHVANYYFKRGAYLAAANRGRYVIENFQQTPAVPDGLAVMAQAYYLLDLHDLAAQAEHTLASNYPQHPALDEEGKFKYKTASSVDKSDWLSQITFGYYLPENPPSFDSRSIYDAKLARLQKKEDLPIEAAIESAEERSWLSRLTFGLFN